MSHSTLVDSFRPDTVLVHDHLVNIISIEGSKNHLNYGELKTEHVLSNTENVIVYRGGSGII